MAIELKKEVEEFLCSSIKRYFDETMDEEIGDLKASLFLDFCLREIGPSIYNQAVADVQGFFYRQVEDLEGSLYEPEFAYWQKKAKS